MAPDRVAPAVAFLGPLLDILLVDLDAEALPSAVFVMQGIENLICYGKRLFGARAGLPIHDRASAMRPSEVGLAMVERFAFRLGTLGG